jgi:hypothetical protein
MCVYIHIYIYVHTYKYVYVYIYLYVYINKDVHTCIHTYIHTYIYIYIPCSVVILTASSSVYSRIRCCNLKNTLCFCCMGTSFHNLNASYAPNMMADID